MTEISPWILLRAGNRDEGLRRLREGFEEKRSTARTTELGVAYLWTGDFEAAFAHFDAANQRRPFHSAPFYEMAGVAKWCLNVKEEAVAQWHAGLKCAYADASGGVRLPLLLYVASVLLPGSFPRAAAEELLTVKTHDGRTTLWPGPLGNYLLGQIDEAGLISRCVNRDGSEDFLKRGQANFYFGVQAYDHGELGRFQELMRKVIVVDDDDFDLENPGFVAKFWRGEYFLARDIVGPSG
jgi:hypothetical protein